MKDEEKRNHELIKQKQQKIQEEEKRIEKLRQKLKEEERKEKQRRVEEIEVCEGYQSVSVQCSMVVKFVGLQFLERTYQYFMYVYRNMEERSKCHLTFFTHSVFGTKIYFLMVYKKQKFFHELTNQCIGKEFMLISKVIENCKQTNF